MGRHSKNITAEKLEKSMIKRKQQGSKSKASTFSLHCGDGCQDEKYFGDFMDDIFELSMDVEPVEHDIGCLEDTLARTDVRLSLPSSLNSSWSELNFDMHEKAQSEHSMSLDDFAFDDVSDCTETDDVPITTDAEILYEAIVCALVQPDLPELFVNGSTSSLSQTCVLAVNKYAHADGDIHTAVSVVLEWLRQKQHTSLKSWCTSNGINIKAMKSVMYYLTTNCDDDVIESNRGSPVQDRLLKRIICEMYKSNIAFSLGHPDAGYVLLSSGKHIASCPSSSIRFLDNFSKYSICIPRHIHISQSRPECHFVVVLNTKEARSILTDLCITFDETEFSSMVVERLSRNYSISRSQSEILIYKWSRLKVSEEAENIPGLRQSIVDVRDLNNITVYAPKSFHSTIQAYTEGLIEDIRSASRKATKNCNFPPNHKQISLHITEGGMCTYNRGSNVTSDLKDWGAEESLVKVNIDVTAQVRLNEEKQQNTTEEIGQAHVRKCLEDLNEKSWEIVEYKRKHNGGHVTIVFHDRVTAKRGLYFLKGESSFSVLNETEIEEQMNRCIFTFQHQAMVLMGDCILSKLERFHNSPLHKRPIYKITSEDEHDITVTVTVQNHVVMFTLIDSLVNVCKPKILPLERLDETKPYLLGINGPHIIESISEQTGTIIRLSPFSDELRIYGGFPNKQEASNGIEKALKMFDSSKVWTSLGRLRVSGVGGASVQVSRDIFQELSQVKFETQRAKRSIGEVHIDQTGKNVWLLSESNSTEKCLKIFQSRVNSAEFGRKYSTLERNPKITFDTSAVTFECVACYTLIPQPPYIVESCGHFYCVECVLTQIQMTSDENRFPMCCAKCDVPFSARDVNNIRSFLSLKQQTRLLRSALCHYVTSSPLEFGLCPYGDCFGFFEKDADKETLTCLLCTRNVCKLCYEPSHDDFTCELYHEIGKWLAENPRNRKLCPSCSIAIEKDGGCNTVACINCKKFMCWKCMRYFDTGDACTFHIQAALHFDY